MGIGGVGIDGGLILAPFVEEVKHELRFMAVFGRGAADEPVVGTFGLSCGHDVLSRLGLKVAAFVPVNCHILYELKGIKEAVVDFRHVCGHLKRAVHGHVQG